MASSKNLQLLAKSSATALALGVAVLFGGAPAAQAQIKIGAVVAVTGPASFLGDPEKRTLEMYVEEINAKGGVNGQKLQLVVYDDGGDAMKRRRPATHRSRPLAQSTRVCETRRAHFHSIFSTS